MKNKKNGWSIVKKIALTLGLTSCLSLIGCSSNKETPPQTHELSGLEYSTKIKKGEYSDYEIWTVKNPLDLDNIDETDVYVYSDLVVKVASLILDKPESELIMFKDMSNQIMSHELSSIMSGSFAKQYIEIGGYEYGSIDRDDFLDFYEKHKKDAQSQLNTNRTLSRIDYLNYPIDKINISSNPLDGLDENATDEELAKAYSQIDSEILDKYKYVSPYDVNRANFSEGFKKWRSDNSYQPTREEWNQMSTYEKDQIEAWEIEKYWTQYPEKDITPDEVKAMIKKERPWMFE